MANFVNADVYKLVEVLERTNLEILEMKNENIKMKNELERVLLENKKLKEAVVAAAKNTHASSFGSPTTVNSLKITHRLKFGMICEINSTFSPQILLTFGLVNGVIFKPDLKQLQMDEFKLYLPSEVDTAALYGLLRIK